MTLPLRTLLLATAAAATAVPLYAAPAPAPAPAATATTPATQMAHISLTTVGHGSPVILIPGLSSPRATWDGVVPRLAGHHTVHLVQVNGFAGDDPRANLTPRILDGVVADLHAYLAERRLGAVPVVGHSMGGLIGLMLAKGHPADIGRLMVVDALPFIGTLFSPAATVAMVEPQAARMRDAIAATYGKPTDSAYAQRTAQGLALKAKSQTQVAAWVAQADPRVSARAMYEDMTTDLRPAMATIATPITLVYPQSMQADPIYRAGYKDAPHVTFVPIADTAHFVMLDQPAAFQAALDTFLHPSALTHARRHAGRVPASTVPRAQGHRP